MKKVLHSFLCAGLAASALSSEAQVRYVDDVFTEAEIMVQSNVIYGLNFQEYAPASIGGPQLLPLVCDVYMPSPTADTETNRPVIIYFHTGSFLPKGLASPMGDRNDSAAVEFCRRFAKKGYVAISASYRVGWLANSTNLDLRRGTNLLAVYKSVQDAKTAVRFVRKTVAEDGNLFGVDPDYITLVGQGSGGYTTLAYSALDKHAEVVDLVKFQYEANGPGILGGTVQEGDPYVDTAIVGDWNGRGGMVTLTGNNTPLGLPEVDLTATGRNFVNYPSYSDAVNAVVNFGGAMGDSTWINAGEAPIISVHSRFDFFAPYYEGMVNVPVGGAFFPVVEVAGSHSAIRISNALGNADDILNGWFQDPISVLARNNVHNTGNQENLLTFNIPPADPAMPFRVNANPWDWWDPADPQSGNETNPNIKSESLAYIDTVMEFITPRIATQLKADGLAVGGTISTVAFEKAQGLSVFPNPTTDKVVVALSGNDKLARTTVFDAQGRVVYENHTLVNQLEIATANWARGIYIVQVQNEKGHLSTQRLSVQ